MDRKSVIILVVSVALFMLWSPLVNRIFPPIPAPTNSIASVTNDSLTNFPAASSNAVATASEPQLTALGTPALAPLKGTEQTITIENENARYTFSSHGGGMKVAELKKFPASVACNVKTGADTNALVTLNTEAPVPAFSLLGSELSLGDGSYTLAKSGDGVRAEKKLPNGLVVIKEFRPLTNYLLSVTVRFENHGSQPLPAPAHELVLGTATPVNEHDNELAMGMQWHNGEKVERIASTWFHNKTMGCSVSTPRLQYEAVSETNITWAAVHNQFFAIAAIPREPVSRIVSHQISLPPPSLEEITADSKVVAHPVGYQTGFRYPEVFVQPNQSLERHFEVYAGPKEYRILAKLASDTKTSLDLIMNYDGFFGFFAKALLLSMNGLHSIGLPYGLAIIGITVIIKLLFWPLTQASMRSMKRMSTLQPQMKAIQEKYKSEPQKMNSKLMEFMKENKVSPVGGCLPMLIQIPVFFGFFTMLRSAIELRGASFLWACDLSQPDTLFMIPGLHMPFNLLPILMTATTLWQTHMSPPSPGMDPVQQKIMRYMPLMFIAVFYNYASGLSLYWTTQNLLSIAQMKLVKNDDKNATPGVVTVHPVKPATPPKKKK